MTAFTTQRATVAEDDRSSSQQMFPARRHASEALSERLYNIAQEFLATLARIGVPTLKYSPADKP